MKLEDLIKVFEENKNREDATAMSKYMKDNFEFLGIKSVKRRELSKEFLKELKKSLFSYEAFDKIWNQRQREYQYVALDYLKSKEKTFDKSDVKKLEKYVMDKAWWDSVDCFHSVLNAISKTDDISDLMKSWAVSENLWLRRLSIIHQLKAKENTNVELLNYSILQNLGTEEFFIDKAIGWALREYSKTDAIFVKEFIDEHKDKLSSLSIREASKYL